jgi:hypothetical protein
LRDFGGDGKIEDKNMWTFYTKHARAWEASPSHEIMPQEGSGGCGTVWTRSLPGDVGHACPHWSSRQREGGDRLPPRSPAEPRAAWCCCPAAGWSAAVPLPGEGRTVAGRAAGEGARSAEGRWAGPRGWPAALA